MWDTLISPGQGRDLQGVYEATEAIATGVVVFPLFKGETLLPRLLLGV